MDVLIEIQELDKHFNGVKALDGFSCSVRKEEILGILGPNGAGKTTLFNVITGFLAANRGRIIFNGKEITGLSPNKIANAGISRTFQRIRLIRRLTVLDNVLLSFKNQSGEKVINVFLSRRSCSQQETTNRQAALALLENYGLGQKAYDPAESLSYGQQKLLSIICCLTANAELLLLDEPVAGIAPVMIDSILSILHSIRQQGKTIILIEHNMDAIARVVDRVVFIDAGVKICEGLLEEVRNNPKVIDAYLH